MCDIITKRPPISHQNRILCLDEILKSILLMFAWENASNEGEFSSVNNLSYRRMFINRFTDLKASQSRVIKQFIIDLRGEKLYIIALTLRVHFKRVLTSKSNVAMEIGACLVCVASSCFSRAHQLQNSLEPLIKRTMVSEYAHQSTVSDVNAKRAGGRKEGGDVIISNYYLLKSNNNWDLLNCSRFILLPFEIVHS